MTADIYKCPCGYGWDKSKVVRHHFCPNCGKAVVEQEPCTDAEVLDKIRAEIVHLHEWAFSREEILRIIDKYKAESEVD